MAKYKAYDYSQMVLLPVSLEEQLMPGTLEFVFRILLFRQSQAKPHAFLVWGFVPASIRNDPNILWVSSVTLQWRVEVAHMLGPPLL